jgi:hypothetical protein
VRAGDAACPFCGASIAAATIAASPRRRLSRSAILAVATSVTACGGTTTPGPDVSRDGAADAPRADAEPIEDAAGETPDDVGIAPPYGIPPTDGG